MLKMPKNKEKIPPIPQGKTACIVWMATYHTKKFCLVIFIIVLAITLLSIGYTGDKISKVPLQKMGLSKFSKAGF